MALGVIAARIDLRSPVPDFLSVVGFDNIAASLYTRPSLTTVDLQDAWERRAQYGKEVTSWDIYRAVLDDRVRTPADFDEWNRRRRST